MVLSLSGDISFVVICGASGIEASGVSVPEIHAGTDMLVGDEERSKAKSGSGRIKNTMRNARKLPITA
jgi:hypothetical protein